MPTPSLEQLGDEIAELSAHLEAATSRLLDLIREFDARGGWNAGFRSCAAWLGWRVGLDPGAARERVRVARALGTLPRLARALAGGELSYAKVRALTRVATPETEEQLLAVGRAGTASHVERIVRGWRRVDRRAGARRSRSARPVRHGGRRTRFRGNVSAPGVRREPGGHAARPGRPCRRSRRPHPDGSSRGTEGAPPPRPWLPLPGLRGPVRPGPSHPSLGTRRSHHALEPGHALSPPPSRRPRGGLPARSIAGRRAPVPPPGRPALARRPASSRGARRPREDPASAARRAGASPARTDRDPELAGRAPGRGLGDRRSAPAGAAVHGRIERWALTTVGAGRLV